MWSSVSRMLPWSPARGIGRGCDSCSGRSWAQNSSSRRVAHTWCRNASASVALPSLIGPNAARAGSGRGWRFLRWRLLLARSVEPADQQVHQPEDGTVARRSHQLPRTPEADGVAAQQEVEQPGHCARARGRAPQLEPEDELRTINGGAREEEEQAAV